MATAAEESSGELYTPPGDEGQSPGDIIPVDQAGLRGKKRHHSYRQPQADDDYFEDSQPLDLSDDISEPVMKFYWTPTETCTYRGYPYAQHPCGHWVEAKYDESGNLIPAPRGTFPYLDQLEDEERERREREEAEERERRERDEFEERELREADQIVLEAFLRVINEDEIMD